MQLYLKIWRQKDRNAEGKLEEYKLDQLNSHMSFLEMLDTLNEKLILEGKEPVEFDHDCREGICGQCGMMINGIAHGPLKNTTTCQLHLRSFEDGDTIVIEPFRAAAFPVKKDLKVDRSALDRIIASGGFVSVNTGQAPDAKQLQLPTSWQKKLSMQQHVSVVVHVWRPVRMPVQLYLLQQNFTYGAFTTRERRTK
jgi:succinate dehydrogenase / fumarate reductase iron-sulfur subunit